jgi:predicted small metal-binding protein
MLRRHGPSRLDVAGWHLHVDGSRMKEVTCMCGWQTRGTADEIVAAIQDHGESVHGSRPSREEVLALAVDLGPAGDAATA